MARTVGIGIQDFGKIIENNCFYVDKTWFIKEWWESMDDVTLITRPRRFGKTLTMSMLDYFFSIKSGTGRLFANLSVWQEEKYRCLQGTYPVIFFSFSNVKGTTAVMVREKICQVLADVYARHQFLLDGNLLTESEKNFFHMVSDAMKDSVAASALNRLSAFLYRYYKKRVIILLDEYDTPMQQAYVHGFWEELVDFVRDILHAAFKDNPCMERGMMTGITRVSKESVFSGLNNLEVVTTTSVKYEDAFGFTEQEVFSALGEFGLSDQKEQVKRWYDGFRFGTHDNIYNPWSVINYLDKKEFRAYWSNTSSNQLAGKLIQNGDSSSKLIMEDLLNGKSFRTSVDEEIIFKQLDRKKTAVWSLLLASGYLKVRHVEQNRKGQLEYVLALTNREVCMMFDEIVKDWFSSRILDYNEFSDALLSGNVAFMNEYMNTIAMETFSSFDTGTKPSGFKQPENFYHGFVLGLIADLRNIYHITSNRESGFGRYDVVMEPVDQKQDDGMILEFKVQDAEKERSLHDTVNMALRQIVDKNYAAQFAAKGIRMDRIRIYGFAFRGKEILVDGGFIRDVMKRFSV